MKRVIALTCFLASPAHALLVQTPHGTYEVQQTPGGFDVYGLSGQGVTTVIRNGGGYSVIAPDGVTNVYGTDAKPTLSVDPSDLSVTPIPNMSE